MYYERIWEAEHSGGAVESLIFDKMSAFKSVVPRSDQESFTETFDMMLMGCISHRKREKRFYLGYPTVGSGVNFMIHCVQAEVKRMMDEGRRPTKLFIEIDGASDNTAKAFTAFCEHLVLMGFCDVIEIWRLPVGHTHEVRALPHTATAPHHLA